MPLGCLRCGWRRGGIAGASVRGGGGVVRLVRRGVGLLRSGPVRGVGVRQPDTARVRGVVVRLDRRGVGSAGGVGPSTGSVSRDGSGRSSLGRSVPRGAHVLGGRPRPRRITVWSVVCVGLAESPCGRRFELASRVSGRCGASPGTPGPPGPQADTAPCWRRCRMSSPPRTRRKPPQLNSPSVRPRRPSTQPRQSALDASRSGRKP